MSEVLASACGQGKTDPPAFAAIVWHGKTNLTRGHITLGMQRL